MKLFLICPLLRFANDGSRRSTLKRLKHMSIGGVRGAALPSEVGDCLVKNESQLISRFGSAECGFLPSSHGIFDMGHAWQYQRLVSKGHLELRVQQQPDDSGLCELITGNKFDPATLEISIAASEVFADVIMFGNGKPDPGAMLLREEELSRSYGQAAARGHVASC